MSAQMTFASVRNTHAKHRKMGCGKRDGPAREDTCAGFSIIEILIVLGIVIVLAAGSIPIATNILKSYHLSSATSAITGAIQGTRYQAIMVGCPYTLALTNTTTSYQIASKTVSGAPPVCAASFSNVGAALPWASTGDVSMSPSTTLQFCPNGTVTAGSATTACPATNVAAQIFTVTNGITTSTITVSGVGDVNVKKQ